MHQSLALFHCKQNLIYVIIAVLFLVEIPNKQVAFALTSSESNCNLERLANCQAPLIQLLSENEYIIAVNKTQLLKVCKQITPMVECSDDFLSNCMTESAIEMDKMFLGFRTFLNNVCDENNQISKDYLKYTPCMTKVEDQIRNCTNENQLGIDYPTSPNEYTFDNVCCKVKRLLHCSREVYRMFCGEDAANIGHQTLVTMLGPTIQKACMDENGNLKCSKSSHLVHSIAIIFILLLIIIHLYI